MNKESEIVDNVKDKSNNKDWEFKVGNDLWEKRSTHGRNPKFETPEVLEKACKEYFQWVNDNPLMAVELVKFQGVATQAEIPKMRAMSIKGLCVYLDISTNTWTAYKGKDDFLSITTWVENVIYTYKFEGAAADLLNPSIIARELQLKDINKHVTDDGDAPVCSEVNINMGFVDPEDAKNPDGTWKVFYLNNPEVYE